MAHDSLRILLVEDDPFYRMLLQKFIEEEGHTVCGIATNSQDVWREIAATSPDVVFMDLILEDGPCGMELTRSITRDLQLPVIILSGSSEDEVLQDVPESGALNFLAKPISFVSLRMNLRIAVRHHALQKNLAASEEKYRVIYNNAATGIYLSSPEGRFLTCNQTFATILGYDSPDELLQILRKPDDQYYAMDGRGQDLLALLQEKREVPNFESEVLGRDGDMLWVSESCTPVCDADGHMQHYVGVVSDITARRQAEYAFRTTYNLIRTTIDSLHDNILVTDLGGHLIMGNSAAAEMLGHRLEEGEKLFFLVDLPDTSPFIRFQEECAPQSGMVSISPDAKPFHYTVVPYKNAKEEVIGAVHVLRHSA